MPVAELIRKTGIAEQTFYCWKKFGQSSSPEFISRAVDDWAHRNNVKLDFSRPAKPTDNPFIESFNGKLRQECLDQHWFRDLEEAKVAIETWRKEYNQERPHRSLGGQTPLEFEGQWRAENVAQRAA